MLFISNGYQFLKVGDGMLFSIFVPIYNAQEYLLECLNSIANQSFKDFEVILVDDGSNDGSEKICDDFCANHEKFKVFHKLNEGALKTRLFGRDKANGDYFVSIDSDDYIKSDMLEILKNKLIELDYPDILCFNMNKIANGLIIPSSDSFKEQKTYVDSNLIEIYEQVLSTYKFNSLCTKIIKTSLFKSDNTNYSKNFRNHGEDIAISLFSIFNAKSIAIIDNYLYYYRQNDSSTTHKPINLCDIDKYNIIEMVELKLDYINKYNLNKSLINDVLLSCIRNLKEVFIRSGLAAEKNHNLKSIINYDWTSFLPNDFDFKNIKSKITNLKRSDTLVINAIKSKSVFCTKFILSLYKMFYKLKKQV